MTSAENAVNIIEGKWKCVQTEQSKAGDAQSPDGSDQTSMASTVRSHPKKKSKVVSKAQTLVKTVVHKLTPMKQPAASSVQSSSPTPPGSTAASNMVSNHAKSASSVSVHTADLLNLIEVSDSDDESDTGSVKEIGMAEDDNEKKLQQALKTWNATVYAFYSPILSIIYCEGHKCYVDMPGKGLQP
ncbi:hypothetical protein ARMSODRAFT_1015309 [Armillaria solidipes]|uniref:Uncharacterized protein n=1 Tax=Armillaria solidipes TaxID=1076256 RepID=A0A2H3BS98_9AGAR|nr:hypothetical protein ARMSODRAFT_1015309 [Armillaria solidipes]